MKSEYCTPDTLRLIMRHMQPDNALALEIALQTGMRIGDVLKLQSNELNGRTITTIADKTDKPIKTTVDTRTARRMRENAKNGYLFPTRKTGAKCPHKTRQAVFTDMKKSAKYYGVTAHISPHTARKAKAVEVYHKDGIEAVKELLQHDRTSTTMIYALSDTKMDCNSNNDIILKIDEILSLCRKIVEILTKTT